jgi:hypothetical protein
VRGGVRYRCFFFIQAVAFIEKYNNAFPENNPTPEEVESGLTRLSEDFGFVSTLYTVSREMTINPKELEYEWPAKDFYDLQLYLAWEAKAKRDYHEIMSKKANK